MTSSLTRSKIERGPVQHALLALLSQPARLSQDAVLRGLAIWASAPDQARV